MPRNLGESCHLHIHYRGGVAVYSILQAGKDCIQLVGANRIHVWYREAKATKRREMEAGCHSVLIVLLRAGNGTQPDPNEGSETSSHGTVFEKHDECIDVRTRVHETEADSTVGCVVTRSEAMI